MTIDVADRRLINATQGGLPLAPAPYAEVARWLGTGEADVIARLSAMLERGVIRRIGLSPAHPAPEAATSAQGVWDVADDAAFALGARVGALAFVSQCSLRPRVLPDWRYNLVATLHASDRAGVEAARREVAVLLGPACRASDLLWPLRVLKTSGLRLAEGA